MNDFVYTNSIKNTLMPITIKPVGKIKPMQPELPMLYYPRAVQTGVVDLDLLTEKISRSTTLTEADCHAVLLGLVREVSEALEEGNIVRIDHLGTFQISVKGIASSTTNNVTAKNVTSASIVFRPGKRFKKMLAKLVFKVL